MSLDGHMIVTTRSNEFIQAWLTYIELEEDRDNTDIDKEELFDLDPRRCSIGLENNIKMNKKGVFSSTSVSVEYRKLYKTRMLFIY